MRVVAPVRADLSQPFPLTPGVPTKGPLHDGVNEDALHLGALRGKPQQFPVARRPALRVDGAGRLVDDGNHRGLVRLFPGKGGRARGEQAEPEVHVQSALVAAVTVLHGTATRLGHVAHQHPAPPALARLRPHPLHEVDQAGMAEVTIAARAHELVPLAHLGHALGAGETAGRVAADDFGDPGVGVADAAPGVVGDGRGRDEQQERCEDPMHARRLLRQRGGSGRRSCAR